MSPHVAGGLGGKNRFERSPGYEDRLPLCWAGNHFTAGINDITFARVVESVEIAITLRNMVSHSDTTSQHDIAAGLGGKCPREEELLWPERDG